MATPNGALRAPPPVAASLLLIRPPKVYKIYWTWATTSRAFFVPLDHMQTAEVMKYEVPCPRPAHRSFADPSGNIFVVTIMYRCAPIFFSFFKIVFGSFLFVFLFFFFSPFQLLPILLLLLLLQVLFFAFLFFSSYILIGCCITGMPLLLHINDLHISVILRGFSRGPSLFWSIWGQN